MNSLVSVPGVGSQHSLYFIACSMLDKKIARFGNPQRKTVIIASRATAKSKCNSDGYNCRGRTSWFLQQAKDGQHHRRDCLCLLFFQRHSKNARDLDREEVQPQQSKGSTKLRSNICFILVWRRMRREGFQMKREYLPHGRSRATEKIKTSCCSNLNAKSTLSDFYFLLVNKPDNIIAGKGKCRRFFQMKKRLGTNELDTVREQGEQKKSLSSYVKEYLEIGGVLDYFSYSYHLCVLMHIYVSLASYVVTAHVES